MRHKNNAYSQFSQNKQYKFHRESSIPKTMQNYRCFAVHTILNSEINYKSAPEGTLLKILL